MAAGTRVESERAAFGAAVAAASARTRVPAVGDVRTLGHGLLQEGALLDVVAGRLRDGGAVAAS